MTPPPPTPNSEPVFRPACFALLLFALVFAAWPDVFLGSGTFDFRDYSLFHQPCAHYHRETFWRGELPLWNPLNNCSLPFLAQWNTMILYVGGWARMPWPAVGPVTNWAQRSPALAAGKVFSIQ